MVTTYDKVFAAALDSPLERICRKAREHEAYVVANPDKFDQRRVDDAQRTRFQRERLSLAATLRYD